MLVEVLLLSGTYRCGCDARGSCVGINASVSALRCRGKYCGCNHAYIVKPLSVWCAYPEAVEIAHLREVDEDELTVAFGVSYRSRLRAN